MEIFEVTAGQFSQAIQTPYHVFGMAAFNEINRNKADEVFYLLFKEGKYRLGIVAGSKNKILKSPFSAPFGGFLYVSEDVRLQYIEESVNVLAEWAAARGFVSIGITLPPAFYNHSFITKQVNCLWRSGFVFSAIEINYSFDVLKIGDSYQEKIWRNARKNLRISLDAGFKLEIATDDGRRQTAYEIIAANRQHRGFPLHMTADQVMETIKVIQADFFLVKNPQETPVASAIVFHVTEKIVQVVYWGDLPGYSELKPMNFLSFSLLEHYKSSGKEFIDIGHSTENSVPNYGLCEFKESIGCSLNPRYTMIKSLI
jgi:hypothetical protein